MLKSRILLFRIKLKFVKSYDYMGERQVMSLCFANLRRQAVMRRI
jgi:hypothetical protein